MNDILLKNSIWLLIAQVLLKIASFLYTIILASKLGVSNFGLYITALSYFSILSSFSDFGISRYVIRELSISKSRLGELVTGGIIVRVAIILLVFTFTFMTIYILDHDIERKKIVIFAMLSVIPQSIALTLDTIFISLVKIKFSAFGVLLSGLFSVVVGLLFVILGYGLYGVIGAIFLSQVFYILILISFLKRQNISWFNKVNINVLKDILKGSFPYGVLGVIGVVSFRLDTLLLVYFRSNYDTGIYGAAYKFLDAIIFIPSAFGAVLFPILSKLHLGKTGKLNELYFKSMKLAAVLGLSITLMYWIILPRVIYWFLPSYEPSIKTIQILSVAIPFIFMHILSGQVILSTDKYLSNMIKIYILLFIINLSMYLIFIPKMGYTGAAMITVISEALTFIVFFKFINTYILRETS